MVAVPNLVASCVLVAVTVTLPAEAGAVKTPLVVTVPLLADHVTAGLKVPEPFTIAVHWDVALTAIEEGVQDGETEMMVDTEAG
jgi:hypothetical protein